MSESRDVTAGAPAVRSSILVKVILALVLALAVSSMLTAAIAGRLTRNVLADRARHGGVGQLTILQEAYAERERMLRVNLQNLVQILNGQQLLGAERRPELIAECGRAAANLGLDILRLFVSEAGRLIPVAGVGAELADTDQVPRDPDVLPVSSLLLTTMANYVQATPVSTVSGGRTFIMVGGYSFTDGFAYRLRKQIGNLDDVLLVASGQVVGSTLTDPPQRPPALSGDLPTTPVSTHVNGAKRTVAYVPVLADRTPAAGAIGLVLVDAISPLDRSLARARFTHTALLTIVTLLVAWLLFRWVIRPLVRLAQTAACIAEGDLDARFETSTRDEVGTLAQALERMRHQLKTKLEVINAQANNLRESSQRIMTAEDKARQRLARDLHDGIQQQLVVLRMQITMAEDATGRDRLRATEEFQRIGEGFDEVIERLRELTQGLYPSILLDRGLWSAVRSHIRRLPVGARFSWIPDPFPRHAAEVENAAYFLLCEALTNAIKHSQSPDIAVSLRLESAWLVVAVEDSGRGFTPDGLGRQGGLLHMHDRVVAFGGELVVASSPGAGTRVMARFPARPPAAVV